MKKETNAGISFFQRYLTVWVFLCMVAGVLLGYIAPALPATLDQFTYARVKSICVLLANGQEIMRRQKRMSSSLASPVSLLSLLPTG